MTTLPAAALHASSQFRIHQTSGSGSGFDYWFVDDSHRYTAGFKLDQSLNEAPFRRDPRMASGVCLVHRCHDPPGSYLNWSILNPAGEVIGDDRLESEYGSPSALDPELLDEFRLHLEFLGSKRDA